MDTTPASTPDMSRGDTSPVESLSSESAFQVNVKLPAHWRGPLQELAADELVNCATVVRWGVRDLLRARGYDLDARR